MQARRLSLVPEPDAEPAIEQALRVAFATTDRKTVDQHFGSATSYAVYAITPDASQFLEVMTFQAEAQDGNENKLISRIAALKGCDAVFAQAVGASAVGQLQREGVHAQKTGKGAPVALLIAQMQKQMSASTPAWMVNALKGKKDPDRFNAMDEEDWVE